jgi:hypothetical protein
VSLKKKKGREKKKRGWVNHANTNQKNASVDFKARNIPQVNAFRYTLSSDKGADLPRRPSGARTTLGMAFGQG